ncbi:hypothetical protein FORC31_p334 (plasmid) [Escherichia coli]|nr:hypothetical protein FORC31_p334 [Escherichia coli]
MMNENFLTFNGIMQHKKEVNKVFRYKHQPALRFYVSYYFF